MDHREKKFSIDKILIVAVVAGMFALAAADSVFNSKSDSNTCQVVANNIAQQSIGLNP